MTRDTYTDEPPLRIGEAARRLGVSVDTLRRWDRDGKLRAFRLPGGQRMYHQADVAAVIEQSGGAA